MRKKNACYETTCGPRGGDPAQYKVHNIPDSELKGLGLRVEPSRKDGGGKDGAACHNCGCGGAGRAHAYFRG